MIPNLDLEFCVQAGDEEGDTQDDSHSQRSAAKSSAARTARASEWAHTDIFSDDEEGREEGDKPAAK